ncbi:MAG TPA: DUF1598 domain-containing protein [Pirellulales bacterium]|nr:DUF1598 domain-containing protein [Pirellulales bacterium]
MSTQLCPWKNFAAALALMVSIAAAAQAQFFSQAVGGISVDPAGVLANTERDDNGLRQFLLDNLQGIPGDLNQPAALRKISLRRLAEVLSKLSTSEDRMPDEVRFLAGLQRIEYVLVDQERHDIVLAGYGEGWLVDGRGFVVGATTGRPLMQLDDLLIALRTADAAARGGLTCSIDPTNDGLVRVRELAPSLAVPGADPEASMAAIENALGDQTISFGGVSAKSRFAHVLLAADFRMKRLAMNFERSPVRGLPSYLQLIKGNARLGLQNLLPRWWLATHYEPLLADRDGLAWQLRGQGVKCMAEDDFLAGDGGRKRTGKASPAAQKWADLMTKKYNDLSLKEPVFGELRNCMDLAVVAALIFKEDLPGKADLDLGALVDADRFATREYLVPERVGSKASVLETSNGFIISASGGVQVNSWAAAGRQKKGDLTTIRAKMTTGRGDRWWWN